LQVNIKDTGIFQVTLNQISFLNERIIQKIDFINHELQKKQSEVNNELIVSNNFLNVAKAHETQKRAILVQKKAQLERALQQEAATLSSGDPIAMTTATANVAQATHEKMIAQQEYQQARENCINMQRRVDIVQKAKHQIDELYEQTKMQLNGLNIHLKELTQILQIRLTKGDLYQKDYLSQNRVNVQNDIKYKNIPQSGGVWSGEAGNSKWMPNRDETPKQPYGNEKTWDEILNKNGIDGIEFKDGEPDFTPVSKGTVEIYDFTANRDDNFYQADKKLVEQWNKEDKNGKTDWKISDVRKYRKEKKLTWAGKRVLESRGFVPPEGAGQISPRGGFQGKFETGGGKGCGEFLGVKKRKIF